MAYDHGDRVLGRVEQVANLLFRVAAELRAVEDFQVAFEDGAILLAQFVRYRVAISRDLLAGNRDRAVQPRDLLLHRIAG